MKKLLTMILLALPFLGFAEVKSSSSHLENASIKEKLVNELLGEVKETGESIEKQSKTDDKMGTVFQTGGASFYGEKWNGRFTASGERFNTEQLTAAHKSLPFGTKVRVTNVSNGKSVIVKINDRGPFIKGRVIDLSKAAFREIENISKGVTKVKLEILGK
jgi:rare lipoprotein A